MFFVPASINIGDMKINNTDHGGAISFGSTVNINRNVFAKKNQGFGQQLSDNTTRVAIVSMSLDQELVDMYSKKGET